MYSYQKNPWKSMPEYSRQKKTSISRAEKWNKIFKPGNKAANSMLPKCILLRNILDIIARKRQKKSFQAGKNKENFA